MSTTMKITFYECEHSSDLAMYAGHVEAAGGKVTVQSLGENGDGKITIEVEDKTAFVRKFRQYDSFDFSSLAGI